MGDLRFAAPYERIRRADDPFEVLRSLGDEEVIAALAAASMDHNPYLANVLATEAMNRSRRARVITHTMGEGVIVLDPRGRVTFANPSAERLLGWPRDELQGHELHSLVHTHNLAGAPVEAARCPLLGALREGEPVACEDQAFTRRDGTRFPIDCTASPVRRDGETVGLVVVFRDITARKRTDAALRDRVAIERTLATIASRFVAPGLDLDAAIHEALAELGRVRDASRAYVFLLRDDGRLLDNTHEWCAPGVKPQRDRLRGAPADAFRWSLGLLRAGEPLHVPDVGALPPEAAAERAEFEAQGIRSVIGLPLRIDGRLDGFVGFDNVERPHAWNDHDVLVLRVAAHLIGRALERDRGERKFRLLRAVLDNAHEAILLAHADGHLVYANRKAHDLLGHEPGTLHGTHLSALDADGGAAAWHEAAIRAADAGDAHLARRLRTGNGDPLALRLRVRRLLHEGDNYLCVFGAPAGGAERAPRDTPGTA